MVCTAVPPDYCDNEDGIIVQQALSAVNFYEKACREHIICPVFVARDLSGLGWSLKEGHDDTGTGTTGGETDAI